MALRPSDIPDDRVALLSGGDAETANLAEWLALDHAALAERAAQDIGAANAREIAAQARRTDGLKITALTRALGAVFAEHADADELGRLASHRSDAARNWACYALCADASMPIDERLKRARPFADDPHFGVREIAWLAVRDGIIEHLGEAIALLTPWAEDDRDSTRRFATEATRPRGVWCAHIRALRENPEAALPLLEPNRAHGSKYVQDSVANWLNDASKDRPEWVVDLTDRWLDESDAKATARIVKRARRTIDKKK